MKKLSIACLLILCFVGGAYAWWYGYVYEIDGETPVEHASVICKSESGHSDTIYTNENGRWVHSFKTGMVEDQYYYSILGDKDGVCGFTSGGTYTASPHIQKGDIILDTAHE